MTRLDRRRWLLGVAASVAASGLREQAFEQGHTAWTTRLRKHVAPVRSGQASQVRYAARSLAALFSRPPVCQARKYSAHQTWAAAYSHPRAAIGAREEMVLQFPGAGIERASF